MHCLPPTMVEMIHADAVRQNARHAEFRLKLASRAADLFNAFVQDCVASDVELDEIDAQYLWNAAMSTARVELDPVFSGQPLPSRFKLMQRPQ